MAKSKKSLSSTLAMPQAPFIFINDPTTNSAFVTRLTQFIPKAVCFDVSEKLWEDSTNGLPIFDSQPSDNVTIFADSQLDENGIRKRVGAAAVREAAIHAGCNFASINLYFDEATKPTSWGTNHFNLLIQGQPDSVVDTEVQLKAEQVYQWLFSVLTVKETLHLIPDEQMREVDRSTSFKDYAYCPISQCQKVKKDAKIQFVALIVSKPAIVSENKLGWQVADKTGVANFFFQWRGPSSQLTWDWVLKLEPGQRKCLPRMPSVLIKETLLTTIVKAPVRIPGTVIHVTGKTIKKVGSGISYIGKSMQMGKRKKWVLEADLPQYLTQHKVKVVPSKEKITVKVFTEKGRMAWSDKDSSRSTLAGDDTTDKTKSEA